MIQANDERLKNAVYELGAKTAGIAADAYSILSGRKGAVAEVGSCRVLASDSASFINRELLVDGGLTPV